MNEEDSSVTSEDIQYMIQADDSVMDVDFPFLELARGEVEYVPRIGNGGTVEEIPRENSGTFSNGDMDTT